MTKNYFKDGEWNVICVICGRKKKSSYMRRRWDGQMVCKDDLDPRHPQDFVRGVSDNNSIPFAYPRVTDTFLNVCGITSVAGIAVSGCMIAGAGTPALLGTNDGGL